MGGGDLNLKKSWHPSTMRNQEKVWKAEQQKAQEEKKMAELQRELQEERHREFLKETAEESGAVDKTGNTKLEWMYKGPGHHVNREEYLLGRKIDRALQQIEEAEKIGNSHEGKGTNESGSLQNKPVYTIEHEIIPESIARQDKDGVQVDLKRKLAEDPLLLIRKKEEETKRAVTANPIKMKQLQLLVASIKGDKKKKKHGKHKKKRKHENSGSGASSCEDLDLVDNSHKRKKKKRKRRHAEDSDSSDDDSYSEKEKNRKRKRKKSKRRKEESSSESTAGEKSNSKNSKKKKKRKRGKDEYKGEKTGKLHKSARFHKREILPKAERNSDTAARHQNSSHSTRHKSITAVKVPVVKDHTPRGSSSEEESRTKYNTVSRRSRAESPENRERHTARRSNESNERCREDRSRNTDRKVSRTRLSEEEMERKRQEMMDAAKQRDTERQENVKRYAEEQEKEDREEKNAEKFLRKHVDSLSAGMSVENRVKSRASLQQRGNYHMETNFMKK